jgi:hypothetical protein
MGEYEKHPDDPLESELASFQPVEPTAQLGARISSDLAHDARSHASLRGWVVTGIGLAAAACVVVGLWLWRERSGPAPTVAITDPPVAPVVESVPLAPPTSHSYERALARSPEAFEALLDRHAERLLRSGRNDKPLEAYINSRADLHELTGDDL